MSPKRSAAQIMGSKGGSKKTAAQTAARKKNALKAQKARLDKRKEKPQKHTAAIQAKIKALWSALSAREREVMEQRGEGRTLEDVGNLMGITKQRVAQIEKAVLGKIRGVAK